MKSLSWDDLCGSNKRHKRSQLGYWTFGVQKHVYVSLGGMLRNKKMRSILRNYILFIEFIFYLKFKWVYVFFNI